MVWKLDRLGRSVKHLVTLISDLNTRGIHFQSITDSINTLNPMGKFVFHILSALAEMERELIVERTKAGLAAARARGCTGGRPSALSEAQKTQIARALEKGATRREISVIFGLSVPALYRYFPAKKTCFISDKEVSGRTKSRHHNATAEQR